MLPFNNTKIDQSFEMWYFSINPSSLKKKLIFPIYYQSSFNFPTIELNEYHSRDNLPWNNTQIHQTTQQHWVCNARASLRCTITCWQTKFRPPTANTLGMCQSVRHMYQWVSVRGKRKKELWSWNNFVLGYTTSVRLCTP